MGCFLQRVSAIEIIVFNEKIKDFDNPSSNVKRCFYLRLVFVNF